MKRSQESLPPLSMAIPTPGRHSALLLIDLQNDYFPGGALGISEADTLIPTINACIRHFSRNGWPILATRDWHPPTHCSFQEQQGPWLPHCIQGSRGAQFHSDLVMPPGMMVISKGTQPKKDSTSCFEESSLEERLEDLGTKTLWILGLGTAECLKKTLSAACRLKLTTIVFTDAVKTFSAHPTSETNLLQEIVQSGGRLAQIGDLDIPIS